MKNNSSIPTMGDWAFCQIMGLMTILAGCTMIMGGIATSTEMSIQEKTGLDLVDIKSPRAVSADFFWTMGFLIALCSFFFFYAAGNMLVEIEKEKRKPKEKSG